MDLTDGTQHTTSKLARVIKMKVLHDCMTKILSNFTDTPLFNFDITLFDSIRRSCFVTLVAYPYDIPEAWGITCVRHVLKGIYPSVRCKLTMPMIM